ncbi:fumarylacetoacetate hydrolase family protein [Streptomyces sp. NPDC058683]|uniref:fumarylacetoacetate hydrolase family protein n=1 Tax=Streptomyces sp. NPDC058683 TaxID=3346597 RepID=UPI00365DBDAE
MSFAIGTFSGADGVAFPGLVVDDRVHDLRPEFTDTLSMLRDWDTTLVRLRELAAAPPGVGQSLANLRPLPPVEPSGQVLCAGANYYTHLRQMHFSRLKRLGDPRPDEELRAESARVAAERPHGEPFIFAGLPSALSGADDDVILWGPGKDHDWELELAVVIGKGGRDIAEEDALDHVAGYTMSNDVSTRDVMNRPNFGMTDFLATKVRPTFFPTGPYLVPQEFVPDYRALRIILKVNGKIMQDESVDDIIFGVEQLVSYASRLVDLRPGDLLLTGSPAGNAAHNGGRWLVPGDVMEGEITGLGVQRNLCVKPS